MAYDNTSRESSALANRRRILHAAADHFLARGYAATTVRSVAEAAGLSQESIYKTFGGKAGLLKAVYDRSIAGDDSPIPVAEREHAQAVRSAETPSAAAMAWSQMVVAIGVRIGPLLSVVMAARDIDPAIRDLLDTMDEERLTGARRVVVHWHGRGWLRGDADPETAAVTLWTFNSAQVRDLIARRGWNETQYAEWLADLLRASLLRDDRDMPPSGGGNRRR